MLWLGKDWDWIAPSWELSLIPAPPALTTPRSVGVPGAGLHPIISAGPGQSLCSESASSARD